MTEEKFYIVEEVESIVTIGEKIFKDQLTDYINDFYIANHEVISDPENIPVGTKLIIPHLPQSGEEDVPNETSTAIDPPPPEPAETMPDQTEFVDFNRADIWIGRLMQIIKKNNEYNSIVLDMSLKLNEVDKETDRLSKFEQMQIQSLRIMLNHIGNFSIYILTRYFVGMLPPKRIIPKGKNVETHLLRSVLNHLSTDFDLVLTAVNQRRRLERDEQFNRTTFGETLLHADILAREALAPAQKYLENLMPTLEEPSKSTIEVVTYFSENTRVRILPYYPDIVLVGIPYATGFFEYYDVWVYTYRRQAYNEETDKILEATHDGALPFEAKVPWEFLVIPHEIAHFIYWNGRVLKEDGQYGESFEDYYHTRMTTSKENGGLALNITDWQYQWFEELFCDVYCISILGPAAILGLQALISEAEPETLFLDNGAHPMSGLRPFIGSLILQRAYPDKFPNAIAKLDNNWRNYLDSIGQLDELHGKITVGERRGAGGGWLNHAPRDQNDPNMAKPEKKELTFDEIKSTLTPIIDLVLEALKLEGHPSSRRYKTLPWSHELEPNEKIAQYQETLKKITKWEAEEIIPVGNIKRSIDYRKIKKLTEIKDSDNDALPNHLIESYLNSWGDKGPEGAIVPESVDTEEGAEQGVIDAKRGNEGQDLGDREDAEEVNDGEKRGGREKGNVEEDKKDSEEEESSD